jgi:hypothetical protein
MSCCDEGMECNPIVRFMMISWDCSLHFSCRVYTWTKYICYIHLHYPYMFTAARTTGIPVYYIYFYFNYMQINCRHHSQPVYRQALIKKNLFDICYDDP